MLALMITESVPTTSLALKESPGWPEVSLYECLEWQLSLAPDGAHEVFREFVSFSKALPIW